jgi:hypothetical protein
LSFLAVKWVSFRLPLTLAKHKLFASKSEAHLGQADLFNEVEEIAQLEQEKADSEEKPGTEKKKRTRNTKPFGEHIAREVIIHDIDDGFFQGTCRLS